MDEIGPMGSWERAAVQRLWREYRAFIETLYPFQAFDDAEIEALPGEIFVLRVPEVVGCVALRPFSEGIVEIKRLYVAPEARGRQAGRRLTVHAVDEARRQGYRTVRLDTLAKMGGAIALYERMGFVEIGDYHGRPLPDARFFEKAL